MKRWIVGLLVVIIVFAAGIHIYVSKGLYENTERYSNRYTDIHKNGCENSYEDVLRFHIIANSDSDEDQLLKMKVRDVVAAKVSSDMLNAGIEDALQAKEYVGEHSPEYIKLAEETIKNEGYDYGVTTTLGKHWFPIRVYGDEVYPEGEYEAYRMIIGNGEGKNWWCVLFPSLCMVDEAYANGDTENEYSNEKRTENNIEQDQEKSSDDDNIEIRFAFVEWLKHLW